MSNDTLAQVNVLVLARKLKLAPEFVGRLVVDEMNRREGWTVIQ